MSIQDTIHLTNQGDAYEHFRIGVPAAFDDVFSHFYFVRNNTPDTLTKTLLPSYQIILLFNFGAPVALKSQEQTEIYINECIALGPVNQSFDYILPPESEILVANFRDEAFNRYFVQAFAADPENLNKVNSFTSLWQRIHKVQIVQERVNRILDFFEPHLHNNNFQSSNFADKKYIEDQELNRYQRFIRILEYLQHPIDLRDWQMRIHTFGYSDQTEMMEDFEHYFHLKPELYILFQEDICKRTIKA